jgi:hypothetical protein
VLFRFDDTLIGDAHHRALLDLLAVLVHNDKLVAQVDEAVAEEAVRPRHDEVHTVGPAHSTTQHSTAQHSTAEV